jgi:hypothetical protein
MALTVGAIVADRRRAIVSAFARTPFVQVQVEGPAALALLGYVNESDFEQAKPQALGRRNANRVVFVESRSNPDLDSSVWVAASYGDYAGAFVAFLNKTYGLNASKPDLAGYDVDHLLNRARSPNDSTLIRVEATPSAINQDWGRLFEKASSDPSFHANTHRERRNMSYMICAKLAGEPPPKGPADRAGIDRLANFFERIGIPKPEARGGIESMLAFAYRTR